MLRQHKTGLSASPSVRQSAALASPLAEWLAASARQRGQAARIRQCFGATTLQRAPAAGADPVLSAQYTHMTGNSATFAALDRRVCGPQNEYPIGLVDTSATQDVSYDNVAHALNIPVNQAAGAGPQPVNALRADMLWEMHNALNKGPFSRLADKVGAAPGAGAKREDRLEHAYKQANLALGDEWLEWSKVLENARRAQLMQGELGGAGQIDDLFGGAFAVAGAGWFLFSNYLSGQVAGGHTASYDPAAGTPVWKGQAIMKIAAGSAKASLECTVKEMQDFDRGKKKEIKTEAGNPFRAATHWQAAMKSDY